MAEINIKVDVPEGLRADFEIALAKVVEQFLDNLKISALQSRLESDEEKELIDWSVKLGREAKKDSFKKILLKISPKTKEALLGSMSPKEKRKYE